MNKSVYDNIIAGGIAGISNVYLTYPLRTVVKVQYVDGLTILDTFKNISKNNNYIRFYSGINLTLLRVGLGRCCEAGTYTYYKNRKLNDNTIDSSNQKFDNVSEISIITSLLKLSLSPLDTISNSYQVNGNRLGKEYIKNKYNKYGIKSLYYGFTPNLAISFIGHYIWFSSYSYMDYYLQNDKNLLNNNILNKNITNGIIGFSSSVLSDLVVNPLRIIKTIKQSNKDNITYSEIISNTFSNQIDKNVLRGMYLRTFINAFNSSIYVILWKKIESLLK